MDIKEIASRAGGVVALSLALGLSRGAVSQWRRVPAGRVVEVSRLTGVPRVVLRPDLYASNTDAMPHHAAVRVQQQDQGAA